ncbi:hypothetical protein [Hyalangium sp.]|uniref:hypothetical protein n=1 Tax=Hyalangium sp. TaxID=2028555 RepID=UPI002D2A0F8B|nr:hypothetical protein [Hyalangium sp.]HYH98907.1 hypothetical protein [Hyalangium sp.]
MSSSPPPYKSYEVYRALADHHEKGHSEATLVTVLFRLMIEVEALREALSSPETPEAVRQSYRQAYERIAVLSHNSAGPYGPMDKILRRFFPEGASADRFASDLAMLQRLGATEQEQQAVREQMEIVETYT